MECTKARNPPVHVLDPASGADRILGVLERVEGEWQADLAVSPDGRTVCTPGGRAKYEVISG
jgi:hypothetical protein